MVIKVAELFAGVGGFRLGFEGLPLGPRNDSFKVVWSNQWEPSTKKQHATEVYVKQWNMIPTEGDPEVYICKDDENDVHVNKDISTISADSIPDFDLLCGGFPCQDYSVAKTANKATGIQGKKGVLWWEIRRIVEAKRPRIVVLENVDRLLKSPTSQRGRDFAVMLTSLDELGYVVEWRSINAADYGFPQRRRRVFILAYEKESPQYSKLINCQPLEYLQQSGVMAKSFPINPTSHIVPPEFTLRGKPKDSLAEVSEQFNKGAKKTSKSPFKTCGIMRNGKVYTFDCKPKYNGKYTTLGQILQKASTIPDEYYIKSEDVLKPKGWQYLKGSKKEKREGTDGFTYSYNEGAMNFPEPLDNASRTIITGEGGSTPSRFKHVVTFTPPKSKLKNMGLDTTTHNQVRESLGIKKNQWIRRLTPIELERLNMFPDNHTSGQTDGKRAFFMGNALVVGIVQKLAEALKPDSRISFETHWLGGKGSGTFSRNSKELRTRMNEESISWPSGKGVVTCDSDRDWTKLSEINSLSMWFGKPGKDSNKNGKCHDMRPYIIRDGEHPVGSKNKSELLSFPELAVEFGKIISEEGASVVQDIFRLLQRIRKPSLKCDHIVDNGQVIWSPSKEVLDRIAKIANPLLELLMITEAIARNEDVLYLTKSNAQSGRMNTVGTLMLLIDSLRDYDINDEESLKRWIRITKRIGINPITKTELTGLLGM